MSELVNKVFAAAKQSRQNAYAPYSQFKVGAALKAKGSSEIYSGCNVENSSYGATICAERSSVLQWVANTGGGEIEYMVLVTDTEKCAPCGVCLQVIGEFAIPETKIYMANLNGVQREFKFSELLPYPFDKLSLT